MHRLLPDARRSVDDLVALDSFAIGSDGVFHLSTSDSSGLVYATNASGDWVETLIDSDSNSEYSSLALDNDGNVHMVYGATGLDMWYATNKSGSWVVSGTGAPIQYGGDGLMLVIHGETMGVLAMDYINDNASDTLLNFACNGTGSWKVYDLDDRDNIAGMSIAVDSVGRFHLSYRCDDQLMYLSFIESDLEP